MTGRQLFKIMRLPLRIIIIVLRLLPVFILNFIYDCFSIIPTRFGVVIRYVLVSSLSNHIGENVYIGRYVTLKNIKRLKIGDNVSIHDFSYLDALGEITIGDNVSIAHGSSIISFEHTWDDQKLPIKYNKIRARKIIIEHDVWVGCGVRILSGSYIRYRTVLAAGTVFNISGEPCSLYAGVPSKKIKDI